MQVDKTLKVTDIRQGVKNPNRVNVFIDGDFSFSLDISQAVEYKLKVGSEISEAELVELKSASDFGKLYQRALEWVLVRPRSIKEAREYLLRKRRNIFRGPSATDEERGERASLVTDRPLGRGRPEGSTGESERVREEYFAFSDEIIRRLVEKKYLDDLEFAEWYVESRFVKKGVSRKRLRMELIKKGVATDIIERVLDKRNDEEEILKIIAKKRAKYTDDKLIAYLCRQGFSFELAKELISRDEANF